MSKPSHRKHQKQKEREHRIAKRRNEQAERDLYIKKFPTYEFRTNNAPDGFVCLIRQTLRGIDFRDRTLFHPNETKFLTHIKRSPEVVIPALVQGVVERNLSALHLASMVGHRVFGRIPADQLRRWIPFHDVQFLMAGERIVVLFRSLVPHDSAAAKCAFHWHGAARHT